MSTGAWALLAFSGCAFLRRARRLARASRRPRLPGRSGRSWGSSGSVFGFFLAAYPGVLLGATARPLFVSGHWLGALFLAVGASTGGAAIALVLALLGGERRDALARAHAGAGGRAGRPGDRARALHRHGEDERLGRDPPGARPAPVRASTASPSGWARYWWVSWCRWRSSSRRRSPAGVCRDHRARGDPGAGGRLRHQVRPDRRGPGHLTASASGDPPVDHALLEEWRALLERRASFRETLAPCEPLLEAWAEWRSEAVLQAALARGRVPPLVEPGRAATVAGPNPRFRTPSSRPVLGPALDALGAAGVDVDGAPDLRRALGRRQRHRAGSPSGLRAGSAPAGCRSAPGSRSRAWASWPWRPSDPS